jgi:hypothetical protein
MEMQNNSLGCHLKFKAMFLRLLALRRAKFGWELKRQSAVSLQKFPLNVQSQLLSLKVKRIFLLRSLSSRGGSI